MPQTTNLIRIAIKLTGFSYLTYQEEVFRFSNTGFTAAVTGDASAHYYYPYIASGILFNTQVDSANNGFSIQLINDRNLNHLIDYNFEGYQLEVYISADRAPNPEAWYPMFVGKTDKLLVKNYTVEIQAKSNFGVFDQSFTPNFFSGNPTAYEGGEELKGIVKPRVIGKVFNVSPYLLRYDNQVYGTNWGIDGNPSPVLEFAPIRDGGNELTLDTAAGSNGDFPSTLDMDAYSPAPGYYVTCLAHGTFKIGGIPTFKITTDVTQATLTYQDLVQVFAIELSLPGFVIHDAPPYTIGGYITESISYTELNQIAVQNLDVANWFDGAGKFNVALVRDIYDKPIMARLVEAGLDLTTDQDIPVFKIERSDVTLPPKQVQVGYRKNYTQQSQEELANELSQQQKEIYKTDFKRAVHQIRCSPNPYLIDHFFEYDTAIYEDHDGEIESQKWLDTRRNVIDTLEVTCAMLSANEEVILGVLVEGNAELLNIASTNVLISSTEHLISDSNTKYSGQRTLRLGDVVTLYSESFDYSNERFFVIGININTRLMQVTYTLVGYREVASCTKNIVYGPDNVVYNGDNVEHNL